jgi:hypothetical protein
MPETIPASVFTGSMMDAEVTHVTARKNPSAATNAIGFMPCSFLNSAQYSH